jgi:hypothetical protein
MMTRDALLAQLREDGPGLAMLVTRASQRNRRWIVVTRAAVAAWEQREPLAWARVQAWLSAERIQMIQV